MSHPLSRVRTAGPTFSARLVPLLGLLALAPALTGCGLYPKVSSEDREAQADCDAESDRIFAVRNRDQMSERDSTDTPYSGNTLPSNPTAGLSDQYERDKLVDACLAHSGAGAPAPAPSGTPAATMPKP